MMEPEIEIEISGTKLGAGGYGEVYKGKLNEQEIAVKKQKNKHARDEIHFLKTIKHPNVVQYLGYMNDDDQIHILIALELCAASLYDEIYSPTSKAFPEYEIIKYMIDVINGYQFIRTLHIVHGDMKSKNVLVDSRGNYKLADFGLSQRAQDNGRFQRFVGSYSHCHPVIYEMMAWYNLYPNVLKPQRDCPVTAEIWSIGVLLFEITNASLPFVANSRKVMLQLTAGKSDRETCGFELPDGRICRGVSFPNREQSDFFLQMAELVAYMLEPNTSRLPTFGAFFERVLDVLHHWRRAYN